MQTLSLIPHFEYFSFKGWNITTFRGSVQLNSFIIFFSQSWIEKDLFFRMNIANRLLTQCLVIRAFILLQLTSSRKAGDSRRHRRRYSNLIGLERVYQQQLLALSGYIYKTSENVVHKYIKNDLPITFIRYSDNSWYLLVQLSIYNTSCTWIFC